VRAAAAKRDYYKVLGVTRTADAAVIRGAYATLSRRLRPDLSEAPEAVELLDEVTRAYRVLSDPKSRALYDRLAYRGPGNGGFGPVHPGVGKTTAESAHLLDDELIDWVFSGDRTELEEQLVGELHVGFPEAERGSKRRISRGVKVRIPPGVRDGQHIAVLPLGAGRKATVELRVDPPPPYERMMRLTATVGLTLALVLLLVVIVFGP
jgi:curved DNA-binding protein CbpA